MHSFIYTLDVLTDGSEYTGDGSLFLSVWKCRHGGSASFVMFDNNKVGGGGGNNTSSDCIIHDGVPVARYAISGLGDCTSRLAADQRFKLHPVKAVFACSSRMRGLWGLPSLLKALYQAGSSTVTVVSPENNDRVEKIISLLESNRKNPTVRLCQVPNAPENAGSACTWWKVYEDSFLLVHAQRIASSTDATAYLYTLLQHPEDPTLSILLIPPSASVNSYSIVNDAVSALTKSLPVIDSCNNQPCRLLCQVTLKSSPPVSSTASCNIPWYYTQPSATPHVDAGLLIRAQRQSREWHKRDPHHFPLNNSSSNTGTNDCDDVCMSRRLRTGTSLVLAAVMESPFSVVDRTNEMRLEEKEGRDEDHDGRWMWPSRYFGSGKILGNPWGASPVKDVNEIDLDELEDDDDKGKGDFDVDEDSNHVNLLCLGTGCASPSPYRGASGYALLFGESETFVFEVGEGFLTQWNRYAGGRCFVTIRAIWISHAHWDHYGGLVPLLTTIYDLRTKATKRRNLETQAKRARVEDTISPPLVVASDKILKYVALSFDKPDDYFSGISLSRDSPLASQALSRQGMSRLPIVFFQSVVVDHSCVDAYGFVVGLHKPQEDKPFLFCFSGDTRPCFRLVEACRFHARANGKDSVDFLLHEASFHESEAEMSRIKKHSTVKEALFVAKDIRAKRVMLTHFSQRYDSPPEDASEAGIATPAFDGLSTVLFHRC